MRLIFRLAVRNLQRNLRRSFLTLLSISLGLGTILWLDSILEGRNQHIIESVTSTYTGHIQVFAPGYLKTKLLQKTFLNTPEEWKSLLPVGTLVSERIHLPSLISSGEQSLPIMLEGIDPVREPGITKVKSNLVEGEFLPTAADPDCESKAIYIGRELASLLNVQLGSKLVILAQAADGTLGNDLFRVKGLFNSGSPDFDRSTAFTPIQCASRVGALRGIHEVVFRLENAQLADPLRIKLQASSGPALDVTTWKQSLPGMATMVKYNEVTHVMISTMLLTLICFGIMNTLLTNIFDRTREFGVMAALGTTPAIVQKMVLLECLVLGALSCICGILLAGIATLYHQRFGFDLKPFLGDSSSIDLFRLDLVVHPAFHWISWARATFITLLTILVSGFLPAYRASRLKPIEAMRSL